MPFGTSFSKERKGFSPTLFWKNLRRFWPLWAVYAALEFFIVPMNLYLTGQRAGYRGVSPLNSMREVMDAVTVSAGWVAAGFGVLFAMALFSYLMDHRSCQMLHALPVRREGLFVTSYLLGVSWFAVPVAVMGGLSLVAGAVYGANLVTDVLVWMAAQVVTGVFFFSFAVFCAMFTGHLLALPVFYGILNALVFGLSALLDSAMNMLLVGYAGNDLVYTDFTRLCTPIWTITRSLEVRWVYVDGAQRFRSLSNFGGAMAYCLVLTAIFVTVAVLVYRRRQLERAGDVVTVGWARVVFQWGLGVCVGLMGGVWLYGQFFNGHSPWLLVVFAAFWAVVGAFAGRMLLKKTVRVFADGWKTPLAVGAVMLVVMCAARLDLFGYQRWVPQIEWVQAVSIGAVQSSPWDDANYRYLNLEDPNDIAAVVAFHQALVGDLRTLERAQRDERYITEMANGYAVETADVKRVTIDYTLDNGANVRRWWTAVPVTAEMLADDGSYAAQLQALYNRPGVAQKMYGVDFFDDVEPPREVTAVGGYLQNVRALDGTVPDDAEYAEYAEYYGDTRVDGGNEVRLTADEARALYAAVLRDMETGNIGRRYLLDSVERYQNCYLTDLRLELLMEWVNKDGERTTGSTSFRITVQKSAAETLKVLDELGYTDRLLEWEREE